MSQQFMQTLFFNKSLDAGEEKRKKRDDSEISFLLCLFFEINVLPVLQYTSLFYS